MRRIINSTNITLDGVMQRMPEWHFDYMDDEAIDIVSKDINDADAVLMGRGTYEVFAATWPTREGDYADRINAMPKYVASSTLKDTDWNNTTILPDAAAAVAELRQQSGGDILGYGFGPVARTLLQHDLLDEIRFFLHPVLAGGKGEWSDLLLHAGAVGKLNLVGQRTLDSGVVLLTYTPQGRR